MFTMVPGQVGSFSQCASPDITKSLESEFWACPSPSIWTECHVDGFLTSALISICIVAALVHF